MNASESKHAHQHMLWSRSGHACSNQGVTAILADYCRVQHLMLACGSEASNRSLACEGVNTAGCSSHTAGKDTRMQALDATSGPHMAHKSHLACC